MRLLRRPDRSSPSRPRPPEPSARILRNRPLRALAVGLVAAAAALALGATGLLDGLERDTVDERFTIRGSQGAPADVVVVGIGEDSLGLQWPFPRSVHAAAIDALRAAGARTVVYDVQFSEPTEAEEDQALIAAAAHDDVILGSADVRNGRPEVIGAARVRAGQANVPADPDGTMRRLERRVSGVPTLAALAAGADPDGGDARIDFAGPPGTVTEIPFWRVVEDELDPAEVRGKIVVVGATAPSLQDLHGTAAGGGLMAGAEVQANAIQTLLDGVPLDDAPGAVDLLLVLAAALLAPLATIPGPPARGVAQALAAGAVGLAALLVGAQLAFDAGTVVEVVVPFVALALGTLGAVGLTYALEVRSRRRVRAAFERFVPPAVVDELLRRPDPDAQLESRRVEATVLFCDLRGFTTLAEGLEAEQVIAALNRYLELVSGAVFEAGGTVVSYQGDGMLAVFGAPLAQPDHAARALTAARRILDVALPEFNAWLAATGLSATPLDAGIGLNTGTVMAGSLGSRRRIEYAAVGDATNVAARLQSLGRDTPGRLFVAGTTHAALGPAAEGLTLHGPVELRGRREPVVVWTGD